MARTKTAIPSAQGISDPIAREVIEALKDNVEQITARRGTAVTKLGATATLAAVIIKLNELIDKLQT